MLGLYPDISRSHGATCIGQRDLRPFDQAAGDLTTRNSFESRLQVSDSQLDYSLIVLAMKN